MGEEERDGKNSMNACNWLSERGNKMGLTSDRISWESGLGHFLVSARRD